MKAIITYTIAFVMLFGIAAQAQDIEQVKRTPEQSRAAALNEPENPLAIKLFPNPANSQVNISLENKEGQIITITVTDIGGKVMHMREVSGGGLYRGEIDISTYAPGAYVVNIDTGKEKIVRTINKY